jgi:transcriptional regulator with XRE-family HTH domain
MSRRELASSARLSTNTVMAIEHGRVASPGVFYVERIARALAVRLEDLIDEAYRRCGKEEMATGLVSIGYEGRSLDQLLSELTVRGVSTVADVRLTPISRKKGLSKTRLREALESRGIKYLHLKALGNPKENRANFAGDGLELGRAHFRGLLQGDDSCTALGELADRARSEVVAVLCFEASHDRCHRSVILEELPGADDVRRVLV